jgi:hypothetical protein
VVEGLPRRAGEQRRPTYITAQDGRFSFVVGTIIYICGSNNKQKSYRGRQVKFTFFAAHCNSQLSQTTEQKPDKSPKNRKFLWWFVIEDLAAWNPNLRSKAAIRTSDTRHFVDPSIGTAALGLGPKDLINDLDTFGLFFEDMAVRDLRVYAEALDGQLYHYRDGNGLECDTVLHRRNGNYALLEVKLGGEDHINAGAANMIELAGKIDTDKMPAPSFMAVIIAVGKYAYQRKDGVFVIPIGCLKN